MRRKPFLSNAVRPPVDRSRSYFPSSLVTDAEAANGWYKCSDGEHCKDIPEGYVKSVPHIHRDREPRK